MANPTKVTCTADTWTKVATAVQTGFIWIKDSTPVYKATYKLTGEAAPTDFTAAIDLSQPGLPINSDEDIDVYVYAVKENGAVVVMV